MLLMGDGLILSIRTNWLGIFDMPLSPIFYEKPGKDGPVRYS
jgi:hypothetical protein